MNRSRALVFMGIAFAAAAIGAAACGGDDTGENGSPDAGTNASDATTNDANTNDANASDSSPPKDSGGAETGPLCNVTPCAVSIGAGGRHSCALLSDGTVRCWGLNQYAQLGFGTVTADGGVTPGVTATPTAAIGVSGATTVSLGDFNDNEPGAYSCASFADAGVQCWGDDNYGQLGRGFVNAAAYPNAAPVLLARPAIQLSAGTFAACAVLDTNDIACWGFGAFNQVSATSGALAPTPQNLVASATKFSQVSVGTYSACAASTDKHAWCWGWSRNGELGRPITDGGVQDIEPAPIAGFDNVTQVATGPSGGCALTTDGVAHCWGGIGAGANSLLGRGDVDSGDFDPNPAAVVMPGGVTFTQIVAHYDGYCALDTHSSVWCWGLDIQGDEGILDSGGAQIWVPTQVPTLANVLQLTSASGGLHTCALILGGSVKCWGWNADEQLGTALVDGGADFSNTPLDVVF